MARKGLGEAIRRRREALGLSQLAFAHRAGVSQPALWQVESGGRANPGVSFLQKVARALGVTVADLTGEVAHDAHGDRERGVFRRFAATARLDVAPETVQTRRPPEPDIACEVGGAAVAFELVELVAAEIAQAHADQITMERLLTELAVQRGV